MTNTCFADQFEDDFGGPINTTPRTMSANAPAGPCHPTTPTFSEPCKKCRGSGRFISWSGRDCGPCHTCKGKGQQTFKTSTAQRNEIKARASARKEAKTIASLESFAAEQPVVWQWLLDNKATFAFATSLHEALTKWGHLTDNQLAAVNRCIEKSNAARTAAAARVENAAVIDMTKITEALSHASRNLRRPKLWLGDLVVYPAAAHSQNAGCLYVKQGRGETGIYLGKIAGTKFIRSRECTAEQENFLLESAKDPHAAAVLHGKLTGCCACCGRELTNPESVARGIGPVCAENFGWG